MIKLYHYTDKQLKVIDPAQFGRHAYTSGSRNMSNLARSFYYVNPADREYYFNSVKYCYTVLIDKAKLYDIESDRLNLKVKYGFDFDKILRKIKGLKYSGFIGSNGYNIACLFYPVKINKQKTLTSF